VSFLPLETLLTRFYNIGGVFNKESKQHSVDPRSLGGFLSCSGVGIGKSNVQFSGSLDDSKSIITKKTRLKSETQTNISKGVKHQLNTLIYIPLVG
jgi:hypothetical protein